MRLTMAEAHKLILHENVANQDLTSAIEQFLDARGAQGNLATRNNLCTDPFRVRLRAAFRFNGNTIARKIRADAIQRVVVASSLPSIAMHRGCTSGQSVGLAGRNLWRVAR